MNRVIRTVVHAGNLNLLFSKLVYHPLRQFEEFRLCVVTPCDTCLVRDYQQEVTEGLRCPTQFEDPLPEVEMLRRMDITLLSIDHPVSVQEERLTTFANTHEEKREKGCLLPSARSEHKATLTLNKWRKKPRGVRNGSSVTLRGIVSCKTFLNHCANSALE